jgi:oligopeptide/dipeptide ABC transporter ATP-binding protein
MTPKGQRLHNIKGAVPNLWSMPSGCRFSPRCEFARERCREEKPSLADLGDGHLCRCFFPRADAPQPGGNEP